MSVVRRMSDSSWLNITEHYLSTEEADALLNHVQALPMIAHPTGMLYGKPITMHRSIGFFSDSSNGYRYSGQINRSQPLTDELRKVLAKVNTDFNSSFNGILINSYANGEESIGPHSDDERDLDPTVGVAAISLGASRIFRIRPKTTGGSQADISTTHGQLIIMGGKFQKEYTHAIPVQKKVTECRISLTFRCHNN